MANDFDAVSSPDNNCLITKLEYNVLFKQWKSGVKTHDFSSVNLTSYAVYKIQEYDLRLAGGYSRDMSDNLVQEGPDKYFNFSSGESSVFIEASKLFRYRNSNIALSLSRAEGVDIPNVGIMASSRLFKPTYIFLGYELDNHSLPISISYLSNRMYTNVNGSSSKIFWGLKTQIGSSLINNIMVSNNVNRPKNNSSDLYEIDTNGENSNYKSNLKYHLNRSLAFDISVERSEYHNEMDLYHVSQTFGHISRTFFMSESYKICSEYIIKKRLKFDLSYKRIVINGASRGHVDSWPFTSYLVQSMGPKFYGKGSGKLRSDNLLGNISGKFGNASNYGLSFGLNHYTPDWKLTSWNPAFMGIGIMNKRMYYNSINSADVASLGLSLNVDVAKFRMSYSGTQYIPLSIKKDKAQSIPEPGEPAVADQDKSKAFGGSFHNLAVYYYF